MKKKFLVGLLLFVAVLGLTSCRGETSTYYENYEEDEGAIRDIDDESQTELDDDDHVGDVDSGGGIDAFSDGFEDGVFRDDNADFEFHLPDGWTYVPQQELIELSMEMSMQLNRMVLYAVIANDEQDTTSLVVGYEDMMSDVSTISMTAVDVIDDLVTRFADNPDVREISDSLTEVIAGYEYQALRVYFSDFQDLEDEVVTFYVRRIRNHMLTISISGPVDNNVLDYFR